MLRHNIMGLVLLGCLGLATTATLIARQQSTPGPAPRDTAAIAPAAAPQSRSPVLVAQSSSCAGECQAQHDRCRVQTKGSPSCDAERQRCLEICLQKKKK